MAMTVISATVILFLILSFIDDALVEGSHFIEEPHVVGKTLLQKMGILTLRLDLNFRATVFSKKPVTVFLTTAGGTSANIVCLNTGFPNEPKAIVFSPTKGQAVVVQPKNNQINFNNVPVFLSLTISRVCSDDSPPFIRTTTLKNIELHLTHNSSEFLRFNIGNMSMPTAYAEERPYAPT